MAAYAALVSLTNNIEQVQRHTRFPINVNQNQMESLHEKASFLIDFLESYNSRGVCEEMKDLESRIADAAHVAENIIETHIVDRIFATSKGEIEKTTTLSCLEDLEEVLEVMDLMKEETTPIKDRMVTENVQQKIPVATLSSSCALLEKNTMVGFDEEMSMIMERLTGRQHSRQVIPIVGMGGMGKTTLAKTAYDKPFIVKHFDLCAWVSISQEYDLKRILLDLLSYESSQMSDKQLGETLHKRLYRRRYLVVLDDMWSLDAWVKLNLFLPNDNNASRIIVTTRLSTVANYFGSSSIKMNFLDDDKGWNLFCKVVFAQEACPVELEEVGQTIVKNCQGLPLSIVVIAGLLAKSKRRLEYWEYIARDIKAFISLEGDDQCMKILYLSYCNLPVHLKPCFLYMGVFPEDGEICASLLIKMWVAEGFLKPNSSKELEMVGEEYLNDLISRNLILVRRRGLSGKIRSFMIHDLLRDLCLKEAQSEDFLYAPKTRIQDKLQEISSLRRISIPRSQYILKRIHVQKTGVLVRSLISRTPNVFPLQYFRLLRVLKASDKHNTAEYSLDDTFKLVNLRFVAINTTKHPNFPSSFCLLWNLQILIVKGVHEGPIAPLEFWEMVELRHLQFEDVLYLPDPPSEQMKLGSGVIMEKLITLKCIANFRFSDAVVKRMPNIKNLEVSLGDISTVEELEEYRLRNLVLLEKLESLNMSFSLLIRHDLQSNLAFPSSLKKLTLSNCNLQWEAMTMIGSLPRLEKLKLEYGAFEGDEWIPVEGEFCCLKYLEIYCCRDLVHWIADGIHFPCLEHLVLWWLCKLVEIPSGIGEIPTLQSIRLSFCSTSAVISAKKLLEEQEDFGNEDLQVHVLCRENSGLESLASDRFRVEVV